MDDAVSRTSQDSAAEEFVVVSAEPKLHITGDGGVSELERKMTEVLNDEGCSVNSPTMAATDNLSECSTNRVMTSDDAQQSIEVAVGEVGDVSDSSQAESGNSFNNLNTSSNTAAEPGESGHSF